MAEERGIELIETTRRGLRGLHRAGHGRDAQRAARRSRSPGPASARATSPTWSRVWGEDFYLPFADHLAIFRYTDQPGMIGRVGTIFGEEGVNIVSAAVGAEPGGETAVMALTTDAPVNPATIDRILELDGFSRRARRGPLARIGSRRDEGGRAHRPRAGRRSCRSRSGPTRRSGRARCGSPSRPPGSTSPTRWPASASTPTRRSRPACSATRSPGEVESVGEGVDARQGRATG